MKKPNSVLWMTILLVCLAAGDLPAQRDRGDRDGGPRGGGRGMGMRGAQSLISLAANPAVQKDLAVKEEAVPKIAKIAEDFGKDLQTELQQDFGALRDLNSEERAKKMEEMREKSNASSKSLTEKYKPELAKVLDEKQMTRLQQIYVQSLRGDALTNSDVAAALKITDEQKTKLDGLTKEYRDKQMKLFSSEGGGDPTERFSKMRELGDERDAKLLEVLTADQRKELDAMKGEAFDLAQLRGGGRGGEGRGFGGGRGGRDGGGRPDGAGRPQRKPESSESK